MRPVNSLGRRPATTRHHCAVVASVGPTTRSACPLLLVPAAPDRGMPRVCGSRESLGLLSLCLGGVSGRFRRGARRPGSPRCFVARLLASPAPRTPRVGGVAPHLPGGPAAVGRDLSDAGTRVPVRPAPRAGPRRPETPRPHRKNLCALCVSRHIARQDAANPNRSIPPDSTSTLPAQFAPAHQNPTASTPAPASGPTAATPPRRLLSVRSGVCGGGHLLQPEVFEALVLVPGAFEEYHGDPFRSSDVVARRSLEVDGLVQLLLFLAPLTIPRP